MTDKLCNPLERVAINKRDFEKAANVLNQITFMHVHGDSVSFECDKFGRRQLTRYGVSFTYAHTHERMQ